MAPREHSVEMPTAHLERWCIVPLEDGDEILFGYAAEHPVTGGLSWVRSTPIVHLDEAARSARTRSGRLYRLGVRFDVRLIPVQGREAWVAYEALIGSSAPTDGVLRRTIKNPEAEIRWLTAQKIARHLGVIPCGTEATEVEAFLTRYGHPYRLLRSGQAMRH